MARHFRPEDYETPTVEAAAGFEEYYGSDLHPDTELDERDAKRDFTVDEQRRRRQEQREGRS